MGYIPHRRVTRRVAVHIAGGGQAAGTALCPAASWANRWQLEIDQPHRLASGYVFFSEPPVNRSIAMSFPMVEEEIVLMNVAGTIRVGSGATRSGLT